MHLVDQWRCVSTAHGVQFVTFSGMSAMLELPADNWSYQANVNTDLSCMV